MATQQVSTGLFSRLLLWKKFAILGALALILVALPFAVYIKEAQEDIENFQLEAGGIVPTVELLKIVQLTQRHRGMSSIFLSGDKSIADQRQANEREVADTIKAIETIIKQDVADPAITEEWNAATQEWKTIEKLVINQQIDRPQSIKRHSALIAEYLDVLDKLSDHYGLPLDPEAGTFFMIRSVLYGVPQFTEALGKLRAEGSGVLTAKQATPEERYRISALIETADYHFKNQVYPNIQKAVAVRPDFKPKLEPLIKAAAGQYETALKLTKKEVVEAPQVLTYPNQDYFDTYTAVIDTLFTLNRESMVLLDGALKDRVSELRNRQLFVSFGILALLAVGSWLAYVITRSITNPIGYLVGVMNKLASGDSTVRAHLETFDEIGMLGRQFDMMVDQREAVSAQVQRENEALNNSIIELLQAVARLAQRDLTVKIPVAEDITGPVGDALNLLSGETAKVLSRVTEIAQNVAKISQQVKAQSDTVIQVATEDKREVEQATAELNRASEVMQEIARLALACNEAAEKAIKNTERAQDTVLGTVQGITAIRDTIRETEKRIKRLGERSQEIGGVVSLINSIAERTHILALNASMHAASAGEAGRGFAVVANEVQRLAENAREATSKIAGLVSNIQVETADTVNTMNEAISQVVRGTDLAQKAGGEMRETRDTTADLVQLVQRIAASSTNQAQMTQQLRERAVQLQKNTERTYDELQEQGVQTERLVDFSTGLVEAVGVFVLPKAAAA